MTRKTKQIEETGCQEISKNTEYIGKKNLFIVESPAKIKKIQYFLGDNFIVKASVGHIRDLQKNNNTQIPKDKYGIDVNDNFKAYYIIISNKNKVVSELKSSMKDIDLVWLAPDEDREGEGIAWHLKEVLKIPENKIRRVTFNEITKKAVCDSLNVPRTLDMNLVNAQQTRRMLDRLVGFELSPVLWRYFTANNTKLSAGRVQSVATRLIYDRENDINNFVADKFVKVDGEIKSKDETKKGISLNINLNVNIVGTYQSYMYFSFLKEQDYQEMKVIKNEIVKELRNPPPPYTTSTIQQDASSKHSISSKHTMEAAQKLYEAGLITYMRTDSISLSDLALGMVKKQVINNYGEEHYKFRKLQTKTKGAQEAHEAIRPTHMEIHSLASIEDEKLQPKGGYTSDMEKIYKLIWKRTMASQMKPTEYDAYQTEYQFVNYDIGLLAITLYREIVEKYTETEYEEKDLEDRFEKFKEYFCETNNYNSRYKNMTYPGFQLVYGKTLESCQNKPKEDNEEEQECLDKRLMDFLKMIKEGDMFIYILLNATEKETNPKPRLTEASLVKALEDKQIGRPSTYANIISTIMEREYIKKKTIPATSKEINVLTITPITEIKNNVVSKKVSSERNKLIITDIGKEIVEFLVKNFPNIMDYKFTAEMEEKLDLIASGDLDYINVMKEFYDLFHPNVDKMLKDKMNKTTIGGENKSNRRLVGVHPTTNQNIYVLTAKYGNVVQVGEKNATFAPILDKTLELDEVTLEEALDILEKRIKYLEKRDTIPEKKPYTKGKTIKAKKNKK
jgi:DNA topoisomerase I